MSVQANLKKIIAELATNSELIQDTQLNALIDLMIKAKDHHIFLAGAGRSGLAIRGFANRLLHLGFSVSLIGEISNPHSHQGDLLIVGSGSGETESLVALANKARKRNVMIGLVTMDAQSTLAKLADVVVILPGVSPKLQHEGAQIHSIQPMGSAFEQICFLTYDGIILELMDKLDQNSDEMFTRHADLE